MFSCEREAILRCSEAAGYHLGRRKKVKDKTMLFTLVYPKEIIMILR